MSNPDPLHVFEVLARQHEPMLTAYVLALVGSPTVAEDIVQETLFRAYKKLDTLREPSAFSAWLRAIARRLAYAEYASASRKVSLDPAMLDGVEQVFARMEETRADEDWEARLRLVEGCFDKLPEAMRSVCALHYFDGLKAREISGRLGLGLATVLKRLERARDHLRDCVTSQLVLDCP